MERGGLFRIFLFVGLFILLLVGLPRFFDDDDVSYPKLTERLVVTEEPAAPEKLCDLWSDDFHAQVSTRGGSLKSFQLLRAKYQSDGNPINLVTTPDHPQFQPLFFRYRDEAGDADWLVKHDLRNWQLEKSDGKRCKLSYTDGQVALEKTIGVGDSPYALSVELSVENVSNEKRAYALSFNTTDFYRDEDVKNHMFRMNPLHSHVECVSPSGEAERMRQEDFEPSDFADSEKFPKNEFSDGRWFQAQEPGDLAAVSNAYFTNALSKVKAPEDPHCLLQVEELWDSTHYSSRKADPNSQALYKARLAFPRRTLDAGGVSKYEFEAFIGPKERNALTAAGSEYSEIIDLGFFSAIAKVLVAFLLAVYSVIPNWGIAIIVLTITARVLLFPLSVPSIKNMIHMRELKPEIDKLNEKYKDDPQAKGLAQMELWKKHKVNPMKGCLPQLASMPVWFALYTTLQTAVELYNIPFLWFPDLSKPDPYYILPFIIGGVYFLQQTLMPIQADPAQQKMMKYFMPGMFTVFMLFLPAGLGVYMFTNSLLGIAQQQIVEHHVKKTMAARRAAQGEGAGDQQAEDEAQASSKTASKKKKRGGRRA